jgi:hypothetical protein
MLEKLVESSIIYKGFNWYFRLTQWLYGISPLIQSQFENIRQSAGKGLGYHAALINSFNQLKNETMHLSAFHHKILGVSKLFDEYQKIIEYSSSLRLEAINSNQKESLKNELKQLQEIKLFTSNKGSYDKLLQPLLLNKKNILEELPKVKSPVIPLVVNELPGRCFVTTTYANYPMTYKNLGLEYEKASNKYDKFSSLKVSKLEKQTRDRGIDSSACVLDFVTQQLDILAEQSRKITDHIYKLTYRK